MKSKDRDADDHAFLNVNSVVADVFVTFALHSGRRRVHAQDFVDELIEIGEVVDHFVTDSTLSNASVRLSRTFGS